MKNETNITRMAFILDRSGSMGGLEADTIGGYNALIEKQKHEPGLAYVTTVLFDDRYELICDGRDVRDVTPLTGRDYYVRGTTALLDAVGRTVSKLMRDEADLPRAKRADKVIVAITTDGLENASREYTAAGVKRLIEERTELDGWEFLFLGANMDAVGEAGRLGIRADRAVNYHADAKGTKLGFESVESAICSMRCGAPIAKDWKAKLEEDFNSREGER